MGHKKNKSHSLKRRTKRDSLGDVALADFADANVPRGSGRVRKSKTVLPVEPSIEDADGDDDMDAQILARQVAALDTKSDPEGNTLEEDDVGLFISEEIWIMLSEYLRPQDILNFSLICKSSYSVVNTPLFWIKLYKRYYTSKVYVPTFLKRHCLERHQGLKAKVVRSLYYTYPPYRDSLRRCTTPVQSLMKSLIGHRCDLMWVQRASDKEINANNTGDPIIERWIYSFKLSNKPDDRAGQLMKGKTKQDIINYNPDDACRLLEVICKEYIDPKCVIGMKLRKATIDIGRVQLKFSSAPLSRFGTDFGAIDIFLSAIRPPSIYDWWHPHFYNQQY